MANDRHHDESSSFGIQEISSNKPCRACTDFKTWTANIKQSQHIKENAGRKVQLIQYTVIGNY